MLGLAVAIPAVSFADQAKDKGPKGPAALASVAMSALGDAGVPPHRETADQKKRRQTYTTATADKIRAATKAKQKAMTPEMRALVKQHWRIAMRILRVQRIAENANKPAIAKRAADLLAKEDARFFAKLDALGKAAPSPSASGASAPSATPAPSASGGAK